MPEKICKGCNELKDYTEFYVTKHGRGGRHSQCKSCFVVFHKAKYEQNKDTIKARVKAWKQANPVKVKVAKKKYKARFKDRVPPWLSKEQRADIEKYYAEAIRLTQTLGEQYEVDHIVPLRGKTVSGLHVPWNLQIMKASENNAKSNKFTIDPK